MRPREASNIRVVVFDFDGTLADSYAAIAASVNHVRAHYGLPPLPTAEVLRHVGRGPEHLLRETVNSGDDVGDVKRYRAHHPSVMHGLTRLLPGAQAALAALRATGRRAGVCSNKPRALTAALLKGLAIDEHFASVVGPEDAPRHKPAPEMLWESLRQLGATAADTLYVGDMTVDIETARAAGVPVWVVPTGSDTLTALRAAEPDHIITDLAELADWLLGRSGSS